MFYNIIQSCYRTKYNIYCKAGTATGNRSGYNNYEVLNL